MYKTTQALALAAKMKVRMTDTVPESDEFYIQGGKRPEGFMYRYNDWFTWMRHFMLERTDRQIDELEFIALYDSMETS